MSKIGLWPGSVAAALSMSACLLGAGATFAQTRKGTIPHPPVNPRPQRQNPKTTTNPVTGSTVRPATTIRPTYVPNTPTINGSVPVFPSYMPPASSGYLPPGYSGYPGLYNTSLYPTQVGGLYGPPGMWMPPYNQQSPLNPTFFPNSPFAQSPYSQQYQYPSLLPFSPYARLGYQQTMIPPTMMPWQSPYQQMSPWQSPYQQMYAPQNPFQPMYSPLSWGNPYQQPMNPLYLQNPYLQQMANPAFMNPYQAQYMMNPGGFPGGFGQSGFRGLSGGGGTMLPGVMAGALGGGNF